MLSYRKEDALLALYVVGSFIEKAKVDIDPSKRWGLDRSIRLCTEDVKKVVQSNGKKEIEEIDKIVKELGKVSMSLTEAQQAGVKINELIFDFEKNVKPEVLDALEKRRDWYAGEIYRSEMRKYGSKKIDVSSWVKSITGKIGKWNDWFLSKYYDEVRNRVTVTFEEDGLYEKLLKKQIEKAKSFYSLSDIGVNVAGMSYLGLTAATEMSDTRSIVHTAVVQEIGLTAVRIVAVLDARTSKICQSMHNTVFSTERVIEQYEKAFDMPTAGGYLAQNSWMGWNKDLGLHVWQNGVKTPIKEGTASDEVARMGVMLPPYHGWCRTTTEIDYEQRQHVIGGGGPRLEGPPMMKPVPKSDLTKPHTNPGLNPPKPAAQKPVKAPPKESPEQPVERPKPPADSSDHNLPKVVEPKGPDIPKVDKPKSIVEQNISNIENSIKYSDEVSAKLVETKDMLDNPSKYFDADDLETIKNIVEHYSDQGMQDKIAVRSAIYDLIERQKNIGQFRSSNIEYTDTRKYSQRMWSEDSSTNSFTVPVNKMREQGMWKDKKWNVRSLDDSNAELSGGMSNPLGSGESSALSQSEMMNEIAESRKAFKSIFGDKDVYVYRGLQNVDFKGEGIVVNDFECNSWSLSPNGAASFAGGKHGSGLIMRRKVEIDDIVSFDRVWETNSGFAEVVLVGEERMYTAGKDLLVQEEGNIIKKFN